MPELIWKDFIILDAFSALQVVMLGFIGGTLSGFIGSGGAFFMTPGMMNLGVPGVIAVGSNITHKFGKAMMGSKRHSELGNVDKKLGMFLVLTSFVGIRLAVWINRYLFDLGESHGETKAAVANLYISLVFVGILSIVAITMLRDVMRSSDEKSGPSHLIADALSKLRLAPVIYFRVADVKVSLWVLMAVGLATGYLAGTIGVGGFVGVPAMIYVFGMPTAVAAGTELFLAMFMGAFGAINYVVAGLVDLRLTMLLYLGSLLGIYIGSYGTKVVREVVIRLVTAIVILICVVSRAVALPIYLRQLGYIDIAPLWDARFNGVSKLLLMAAGFSGVAVILYNVIVAFRRQSRVRRSLAPSVTPSSSHA